MLGAKAFFIVAGLLQQALLPRAIGLAGYGALSRVLAVANVVNNVVISSATQGVSRVVARAREHQAEALRTALRVHVVVAVVAAALFALAAPVVASFEGATYITVPLVGDGWRRPLLRRLRGVHRGAQRDGAVRRSRRRST